MTDRRLVIAAGPDGLVAAAALAAAGHAALVLQAGPGDAGLPEGVFAVEPERFALPPRLAELASRVLGPLEPCPAPRRGLAVAGRCVALPMSPSDVAGLLPADVRRPAAGEWLRSRLRNGLAEVVGGGQEERSHRDWVVRRMGAPAWRALYAPYALGRWGADSDSLSSVLARRTHALPSTPLGLRVSGGARSGWAAAAAAVRAAGGELQTDVSIDRLEVVDGRVARVHLADGASIAASGGLWIAAPPAQIAGWLGAALPNAAAVEANRLPAADAVRICFPGASLPSLGDQPLDELHLIGGDPGIWRVTSHVGHGLVVHATAPMGAPPPDTAGWAPRIAARLASLGATGLDPGASTTATLPAWEPVWLRSAHARLRTVLVAWEALGIVAVGRGGAFAPLDVGAQLALAHHVQQDGGPALLEAQRLLVQAPARLDDLAARITRFVER